MSTALRGSLVPVAELAVKPAPKERMPIRHIFGARCARARDGPMATEPNAMPRNFRRSIAESSCPLGTDTLHVDDDRSIAQERDRNVSDCHARSSALGRTR